MPLPSLCPPAGMVGEPSPAVIMTHSGMSTVPGCQNNNSNCCVLVYHNDFTILKRPIYQINASPVNNRTCVPACHYDHSLCLHLFYLSIGDD